MNVLMVGAGAVGGFFGAKLVKAGVPCAFLLRPRTLGAVKQHGLIVHSVEESFTVFPVAADNPRELPPPDLVVLSVKRYDLEDTIRQLRPIFSSTTRVLTLQNGVDTEEHIKALAPGVPIIGGVAYIYSRIAEPGVIDHYQKGTIAVGAWPVSSGGEADLQAVKALFEGAGVPCRVVADIRRVKWEKMCWNIVFNPLTVLINDCVAKVIAHPEMRKLIMLLVDEAVAVARAEGVTLDADMAEKIVQWSREIREIHTSMFDDWKAGRRTEIDFLNGYLVRRGHELGVATPANQTVCALIKTITEPPPPENTVSTDVSPGREQPARKS